MHAAHEFRFSDRLRSYLGLRYDSFQFDVDAMSLPVNSGAAEDSAASFKASLSYRPLDSLELYASYGEGFHSNDARDHDPVDRREARRPSRRSAGFVRGRNSGSAYSRRWHATRRVGAAPDSEIFVGDAATPSRATEPRDGRKSESTGSAAAASVQRSRQCVHAIRSATTIGRRWDPVRPLW